MPEHCRAKSCEGMNWFWVLILFIGTCDSIHNNADRVIEELKQPCVCQEVKEDETSMPEVQTTDELQEVGSNGKDRD